MGYKDKNNLRILFLKTSSFFVLVFFKLLECLYLDFLRKSTIMNSRNNLAPIFVSKPVRLFIVLGGFFVANALVAEFIGVKIFSLEDSLGLERWNWSILGQEGSLNLTAGVLLWPIVFIMTDVINEYYGHRGVQILSYLAVGLITYAFIMISLAIWLVPADFWVGQAAEAGVPNLQTAFRWVLGQGNWIIVGSLVAFLVGQLVDVSVFQRIKRWTGGQRVWLRATGSTVVSQFLDSYVVLFIAFVLGPPKWSIALFLAVGTVNYIYKVFVAIVLTPVIYLAHYAIDRYLGAGLAEEMKRQAALKS